MNKVLLKPESKDIGEILGNGKFYKVPPYQRDYSWKIENWEDLWEDILSVEYSTTPHYMGAIVLQIQEDDLFTIIDGQQRLVTISILILACIARIKKLVANEIDVANNTERTQLLLTQYISLKDATSLKSSKKIFLNENNNDFYDLNISDFREPANYRKLKASDKLLWDSFKFFEQKIVTKKDLNSGENISQFLNKVVAKKLIFFQITVADELSAYTVFETLNSRGVELTTTDLLKNYLFAKVAKSTIDFDKIRRQWNRIIEIIGLNKFPSFLRHYLQSFEKTVKKDKLFRRLKTTIYTENDVFDLLQGLEKTAYLYKALGNANDDFWEDYNDYKTRKFVKELNLFRVTQYKSLAISAYLHFDKKTFTQVLRICAIISFRYNIICRFNPNELERAYNKAAIDIYHKKIIDKSALFRALKNVYIENEVFFNAFKTKIFNTKSDKKLVRYILVNIEIHNTKADIDYEETNATIEHILPESLNNYWEQNFNDEEHLNFLNRLGNHTLLEANLNRTIGNATFEEKKDIYQESQYLITNQITQLEWNVSLISKRQERMAKIATSIWMINY